MEDQKRFDFLSQEVKAEHKSRLAKKDCEIFSNIFLKNWPFFQVLLV